MVSGFRGENLPALRMLPETRTETFRKGNRQVTEQENKLQVIDCRAGDHEYLHRDFHGALCYAIQYLDENLGPEFTERYLRDVGRNNYKGLIRTLAAEGLPALERHWRNVFEKEGGTFRMRYEGTTLTLTVEQCPAIAHLQRNGQLFTTRFCETTVVVNDTVCELAGYAASCDYQPGEGRCVQKFWKRRQ